MTVPGIVAVNHVGISVADLAAARAFWIDGLGARDHGGWSWPVGTAPADESLATDGTAAVRASLSGVRWHHDVTESSGGIAAVCYGTTHDGVLAELLESRSDQAFLARCRLAHG